MSYTPRLTAPSATDPNWLHTSKGGKNSCILIAGGSVLPNCVGYAWGRFMELLGTAPKLSRNNAENWWGYTADGYQRGQAPKLGAILCEAKGKAGVASDGAGHVSVVEKIAADGTITTSNSAYGGTLFYTRELKPPYTRAGYTFQGFIYNPAVTDTTAPTPQPSAPATATTHTVVKGDTMSGIAKKYGVTLVALTAANPQIKNINQISVGQKITIPGKAAAAAPRIHTIVRGDTLGAIAKKYGTTVAAIQAANAGLIKNPNVIQVGWKLTIPN